MRDEGTKRVRWPLRGLPRVTACSAAAAAAAIAPPVAAAGGAAIELPSVVVTATRRPERLQDVPLAVSSVSGEQLEASGVRDLAELQFVVPELQHGDSIVDKGFRIRGIGLLTGPYVTGQELPVGVVIDGVVQGIGPGLSNLADIERIEVLKGPQGTQFGKNAAAGVINIVTAKPQLGSFGAGLLAAAATRSEYEARVLVNAPLGESAALRVSAFAKGQGDFIDNLAVARKVGADRQDGARVKLLLRPGPGLEVLLTADASRQDIDINSQAWAVVRSPVPQEGITYGIGNAASRETFPGRHRFERSGVSLEANVRLGDHTLTSLTALRRVKETDRGGFGMGYGAVPFPPFVIPGSSWYADIAWDRKQTTQEFSVTSPKGAAIEYVAGYLYYEQPTTTTSASAIVAPFGLLASLQNGRSVTETKTTSHALFADGKLRWGPGGALLLGARWTRDRVRAEFANSAWDGGALGSAFAYSAPQYLPASSSRVSASRATGKLGIENTLARDALIFATVSTGYLGPIINYAFASGQPDRVKPQTNTNVTLGMKAQFAERRATLNVNLFIDEYRNFQTGYFSPAPIVQFRAENAATLKVRGLEVEAAARSASGFGVAAAVVYVDAKFGRFCSGGAATSGGAGTVPACTTELGFPGQQLDGFAPPAVARWTATLRASHGTRLDNGMRIDGAASYYWRDKTLGAPSDPLTEAPAFGIVNANLALSAGDGRWSLGVYARNLLDRRFTTSVGLTTFAPPGTYVSWVPREMRRTAGVQLQWRH